MQGVLLDACVHSSSSTSCQWSPQSGCCCGWYDVPKQVCYRLCLGGVTALVEWPWSISSCWIAPTALLLRRCNKPLSPPCCAPAGLPSFQLLSSILLLGSSASTSSPAGAAAAAAGAWLVTGVLPPPAPRALPGWPAPPAPAAGGRLIHTS